MTLLGRPYLTLKDDKICFSAQMSVIDQARLIHAVIETPTASITISGPAWVKWMISVYFVDKSSCSSCNGLVYANYIKYSSELLCTELYFTFCFVWCLTPHSTMFQLYDDGP